MADAATAGVYLDPVILGAIGTVFTVAAGGIGWLIKRLWDDRNEAHAKVLDLLATSFQMTDKVKDLFNAQAATIQAQSAVMQTQASELAGLKVAFGDVQRSIQDMRMDMARGAK